MSTYLRIAHLGIGVYSEAWEISAIEATRLGIANAKGGPGCYFAAEPGEDIFDAIRRQASAWFGPNGESPCSR